MSRPKDEAHDSDHGDQEAEGDPAHRSTLIRQPNTVIDGSSL
jgi:hypothetical protein